MMPFEPLLDIMRRTMANLEFVERHAGQGGPYEVTQLINSFLGALAHPWEEFEAKLQQIPLAEAAATGWPIPDNRARGASATQTVADMVRGMRNGMAHGNIRFLPDGKGEIAALEIKNWYRGKLTWHATITLADMRRFLACFVRLIEEIHPAARQPRRIA